MWILGNRTARIRPGWEAPEGGCAGGAAALGRCQVDRPSAEGRLRGQQGVTESMVKPCPVTAGSLTIWTEPVEVGTQAESNPPATVPV